MNETRTLAEFVAELSYDRLPEATREVAKKCVLDYIGGAVFASQTPMGRIIASVGKRSVCGNSTIFPGTEHIYSPSMAALVNGTLGHGFELDDQNTISTTHPGCVVCSSAIAMAEDAGADGKRLIEAVVAGYELMSRCIRPFGHHHLDKGFHPTGTAGVFGATAACCKILGLNADQIEQALGIAATFASGTRQSALKGAMSKRIHGGKGAEQGVIIAQLVQAGFDGPTEGFEGKYGFNRLFADSDYPVNYAKLTEGLGESYAIDDTSVKPFSTCGINNCVIDALEAMSADPRFTRDFDQVEKIVVRSHHDMRDCHFEYHPTTVMGGQYSCPFTVGVYMEGNIRDPRPYLDDAIIRDEKILRWGSKISAEIDEEMEAAFPARFGAVVEYTLKTGETLTVKQPFPKGSWELPLTFEEIEKKYRVLVEGLLPEAQADAIVRKVRGLEQMDSVRDLFTEV